MRKKTKATIGLGFLIGTIVLLIIGEAFGLHIVVQLLKELA